MISLSYKASSNAPYHITHVDKNAHVQTHSKLRESFISGELNVSTMRMETIMTPLKNGVSDVRVYRTYGQRRNMPWPKRMPVEPKLFIQTPGPIWQVKIGCNIDGYVRYLSRDRSSESKDTLAFSHINDLLNHFSLHWKSSETKSVYDQAEIIDNGTLMTLREFLGFRGNRCSYERVFVPKKNFYALHSDVFHHPDDASEKVSVSIAYGYTNPEIITVNDRSGKEWIAIDPFLEFVHNVSRRPLSEYVKT